MADITYTYKGTTNDLLSEVGTKKFNTKQKYCEDDITITYTGETLKALVEGSSCDLVIPDGTAEIRRYAFYGWADLHSVIVPDSITYIRRTALNGTSGLEWIQFKSLTPPTIERNDVFTGMSTDCIIYVPVGTLSAYTSATNYPPSGTYTYIEGEPQI